MTNTGDGLGNDLGDGLGDVKYVIGVGILSPPRQAKQSTLAGVYKMPARSSAIYGQENASYCRMFCSCASKRGGHNLGYKL